MARKPASDSEDVCFFGGKSMHLSILSIWLTLIPCKVNLLHTSLDTLWAIKTQFSGGGGFMIS